MAFSCDSNIPLPEVDNLPPQEGFTFTCPPPYQPSHASDIQAGCTIWLCSRWDEMANVRKYYIRLKTDDYLDPRFARGHATLGSKKDERTEWFTGLQEATSEEFPMELGLQQLQVEYET
ncbi:hypothetical protein ACCO45_009918 [Purpureocillium lilacinum]|uniref:Uncharacterized protein n=1 Tax=Purpureocillium lilacinum TaxID=33203 RepID=A0ACC4DDB7_PURLI